MASRRARVKLAPNLGLSRNKTKPGTPKPKIVVKSDTDNSDAEAISDLDVHSRNFEIKEGPKDVNGIDNNVVNGDDKDHLTNGHGNDSLVNKDGKDSLDNIDSRIYEVPGVSKIVSPIKSTIAVSIPSLVTSSVASTPPTTVYDILTNTAESLPVATKIVTNDEGSDWEDDEYTYKSVEVNENDEIYKSLEITPLDPQVALNGKLAVGDNISEKALFDVVGKVNGHQDSLSSDVPVRTNSPPVQTNHSPKVRLPLGKNKFKPNLNFDRRSRNMSGGNNSARPVLNVSPLPRSLVSDPSSLPRSRTISGSSTSSEPDFVPSRPSPARSSPSTSLLRAAISAPMSPKPAKIRKNTEGRSVGERSQFMRRKLDHKRKFMRGVPERGSLTMFDLIYYNPEYGQRMSVEDEDKEVENADDPENDNQQVPNGLDEHPASEPATPERAAVIEEEALPVPQVKVGLNGEIILDESSLQLETTEQKKAKDLLQKSPVVFENNKTSTNYGTWSKKRRHSDWSERETLRFYRALSVVGSDFSMMESIFKNRTRQELKLKFKKEEKLNNKMIDKCLRERGMYTDLDGLMDDSEEDDTEDEKGRGRKVKKKRPRRRYKNRGYYDSSSGGEDADVETSRSPARKRVRKDSREERQVVRIKRPQVMHRESNQQAIRPLNPRPEAVSLSQLAEQAKQAGVAGVQLTNGQVGGLSGVQFPPGLLAANPGLMGAKPGSLVVVASPNKTDPSSQLLHVYMVSAKNKERLERDRSASPRAPASSGHRSVSPRLTLDPAVVRAVDRTRLVERARTMSESGGKVVSRVRTVSETEDTVKVPRQVQPRTRQRTYSESGLPVREGESKDLRTETIRQRFLSGSARSFPGLPPLTNVGQPAPITPPALPVAKKSKPDTR
eukprot:TRINITY_DN3250_c0_g1_i1.p1 TRINITY_DN3250_c0_g1~~TRINITY_DN3250_c0_g1_i1.p1  ORF type:complete len:894 (-),score=315.81 TRINITY_DN3250_c0_g1_i1:265-2946(-)